MNLTRLRQADHETARTGAGHAPCLPGAYFCAESQWFRDGWPGESPYEVGERALGTPITSESEAVSLRAPILEYPRAKNISFATLPPGTPGSTARETAATPEPTARKRRRILSGSSKANEGSPTASMVKDSGRVYASSHHTETAKVQAPDQRRGHEANCRGDKETLAVSEISEDANRNRKERAPEPMREAAARSAITILTARIPLRHTACSLADRPAANV